MSKPITIPDLRFENSFLRTLQGYADKEQTKKNTLTNAELQLSEDPDAVPSAPVERPIAPITPGIVVYAVIKDIVLRPLVEGFLWALTLLLLRPVLRAVAAHGQQTGLWLASMVGLGRPYTYTYTTPRPRP